MFDCWDLVLMGPKLRVWFRYETTWKERHSPWLSLVLSSFIYLFKSFKDFFIHLREGERGHKQGEGQWEGENLQETPCSSWGPTQGSVSWPWAEIKRQMLLQLNPRVPQYYHFFKYRPCVSITQRLSKEQRWSNLVSLRLCGEFFFFFFNYHLWLHHTPVKIKSPGIGPEYW